MQAAQHRHSQGVLKNHIFFQLLRGVRPERVGLVTFQRRFPEEMTLGSNGLVRWFLICKEQHLIGHVRLTHVLVLRPPAHTRVNETLGVILWAFSVNVGVTQMLAAERADKLIFL